MGAPGRCPCGSGSTYDRCCGPLHRDERPAVTAEQVMRARYSAYATHDDDYLRRSWAADHRPGRITFDPALEWTGLTVVATTGGAMLDQEGTVTFDASHRTGDRSGVLREASRFAREDGRWVYVGPTAS